MQNIGAPKDNGTIDTILVQAQGDTGDHVARGPAMSEAIQDSSDVQEPEVNKAAKYDGEGWKPLQVMDNICNNPKATYSDMALIPAQGRDPAAVNQDVADARAKEQARRAVPPAMGRDPQWVYECNTDCGCQSDGCPEG